MTTHSWQVLFKLICLRNHAGPEVPHRPCPTNVPHLARFLYILLIDPACGADAARRLRYTRLPTTIRSMTS